MRVLALVFSAALAVAPLQGATRRHIVGRGVPQNPFGVFINLTSRTTLTQAGNALDLAEADGIGWVRIQFTWSAIQPTANTVNLGFYNQLVSRAAQDNFQILGVIAYATQWNTTAPASETRLAQREHYPPADYDAWARFVYTLVSAYKSKVHHWEIWNEPDLGFPPQAGQVCNGFWCGTSAQYAKLLSFAYKQVKAADPSATVLLGGLSLGGNANQTFLRDILEDPDYPAWESFEVMNFHSYGSAGEALKRMNLVKSQLLLGGGGVRPIWITEFGYGSDSAVQNVPPYSGGESGQAGYLTDIAPYLLRLGAQKVFWFQLFDSDPAVSSGDPFASYGLLTFGLDKKQAYGAYGDLIKSYRP